MFRGRARTSRVWAARTTSHRVGSGLRTRLARTASENQTGNKRERQRDKRVSQRPWQGRDLVWWGRGMLLCLFVPRKVEDGLPLCGLEPELASRGESDPG